MRSEEASSDGSEAWRSCSISSTSCFIAMIGTSPWVELWFPIATALELQPPAQPPRPSRGCAPSAAPRCAALLLAGRAHASQSYRGEG